MPGLEGDRLRIAVSTLVLAALALNHVTTPGRVAASQATSEMVAAALASFALAQVAVERRATAAATLGSNPAPQTTGAVVNEMHALLSEEAAETVRWLTGALVAASNADAVVVVRTDGTVLARCGILPATAPRLTAEMLVAIAKVQEGTDLAPDDSRALSALGGANKSAALAARATDSVVVVAVAARAGALDGEDGRWLEQLADRLRAALGTSPAGP